MSALDCCKGDPAFGDPRGLHSETCPEYLEQMTALEARRARKLGDVSPLAPGGIVRPSGESTSAALRRIIGERDQLAHRLVEVRAEHGMALVAIQAEMDEMRAERDAYRLALKKVGEQRDLARAELASAREELARLRTAQHWIVARDGGRWCERCEGEVTRGQAYDVQPGTGGLVVHIHCPDKEKSMSDEIEIKATTVGTCTFRVDRAEYEQALAADELDHLFDVYVSDMDEETTYTTPDGVVHEYPSGNVAGGTDV